MKKQIWLTAVVFSLTCCLPAFGEGKETLEDSDTQLGTTIEVFTGTASDVVKSCSQECISIPQPEEVYAAGVGKLYAVLEEEVKTQAGALAAQTQPQPAGNRWGVVLTPAEFDLLTRIVMLEAGGESVLGQQAVTEVILNRMINQYYAGSLEQVLSAKGQFSTWKSRYSARAVPSAQVVASVTSVLNGETNILPLNTLYFSRRAQNRRVQIRIGGHVFCNQ